MTAKIVLDTRYKGKDNLYPIVIRIRNGSQIKHIPTGYRIPEKAWGKNEVKRNYSDADIINADITKKLGDIRTRLTRANADELHDLNSILSDKPEAAKALFSDYLLNRAKQYESEKKIKHANKVRRITKDLQACFNSPEIAYELTADDVRQFNAYLKNIANDLNTIDHKFKLLQQLFKNAIKEKKTTADNVFEDFSTPTRKVQKEKLTEAEITAIENLSLSRGLLNDSRNLFLFSYYCKGLRFEDCVRIRKKDIINGRIVVKKIRKGNKPITVKIHPRLQALIDQYINNNTPYLLPLLKTELMVDKTGELTEAGERERLDKVCVQNVMVNRELKVIAAAAGIHKPLTVHIARHSVAYNLKKKGVSINVIKDVLGHSSTSITEIYLKDLDDETIDQEVNKLYE